MSRGPVRADAKYRVLAVATLLFVPLATALADNKDSVDYRAHVMRTLNEQSAALGQILSGVIPEKNAAAHLEALALTASTALKAFEPKAPGGESKPEVWNNWADFSKRMNEFVRQTREAAKAAKEKGFTSAGPNAMDAMASCKNCHDLYRQEKK
jgi:cytochrome c556